MFRSILPKSISHPVLLRLSLLLILLLIFNQDSWQPNVKASQLKSTDAFSYHTYDSLVSDLLLLESNYSAIAKLEDIGTTEQGRTIWAIKISDNVGSSEEENRVLFIGGHHAREWISVEVPYLLAKFLVESYETDNLIKSVINNQETYIVPLLNPDGHVFSQAVRCWRKNRSDNGFPWKLFDNENCVRQGNVWRPLNNGWGVDTNRNYGGPEWDAAIGSTSKDPRSDAYHGPAAFSEPETQAIRDLMNGHDFVSVLSYHSFSQLILFPWGYTYDPIPWEDYNLMSFLGFWMGKQIRSVNGENYEVKPSVLLYPTSGDLTDWSYANFKIPSFTIELRPEADNPNGFELPASEIEGTWLENRPAAQYLLEFFNLTINQPTEIKPAVVGPAINPSKFKVVVKGIWRGKTKDDFKIKVGGENAEVITAARIPETKLGFENAYELQVQPPTKPSDGRYDLEVIVGDASQLEKEAVLYGPQANVDVVLVIDRSGSMSGQQILDAKAAAKQFVDLMVENDKVGVVSFSSSATVNYGLTTISGTVKQDAKNAIDAIFASGGTSIGAGLQAGGNELTSKGDLTHRWAIVLLSDGLENTPPFVANVLPSILDAGIVVHTIGLGADADEALLQDIASQTGGTFHFAPSSGDLVDIYNSISAAVSGQQTVFSTTGSVQLGLTDEKQTTIDSSVSEATFSLTWGGSDLDLTLITPGGVIIDPTVAAADPNIEFISGTNFEFYRIKVPEVGQWILRTTGVIVDPSGTEEYNVRVVAQTQLFMDIFIEGGSFSDDIIKVTATIADYQPIQGASVISEVTPPFPGSPIIITLFDDGSHDDGQENDGIYANTFSDTNTPGTYQFLASASGISNTGEAFTRESSDSIFIQARPVVTVDVIAPPDIEVTPGASLTHIFTIKNTGTQTETYNLIPGPPEEIQWADLSFIPDSITVGAGGAVQVSVPVNVPPIDANPSSSSLSLMAISELEPLVFDVDMVTIMVPHADLLVSVSGPSSAQPDSVISLDIAYGNQGPVEAVNAVIGIELPSGVEFVGDTKGGSTVLPDNAIGWFTPALASDINSSFSVYLHVLPEASGAKLSGSVGVFSGLTAQGIAPGTPDIDPINNVATYEINVGSRIFLPITLNK